MLMIRHIALVIPAHNEEEHIALCLNALQQSIAYLAQAFAQIQVSIIVVLDNCTDKTQNIIENLGIDYLTCDFRNVGKVRNLGVQYAIAKGADWIACTDADSQVTKDWLVAQMKHLQDIPADMICGVVSVDSWDAFSESVKQAYLDHYQDKMGHHHIHGANLSFSSTCYQNVGGFTGLACHEDVDLVKKFEAHGLTIIWSNKVRVMTSSRLEARAKDGFASFLANLSKK